MIPVKEHQELLPLKKEEEERKGDAVIVREEKLLLFSQCSL